MKNGTRFGSIVAMVIACLVALVAPKPASGQYISHSISATVNTDPTNHWRDCYANGSGGGMNAVATNISADTSYNYDQYADQWHVTANIYVSGVWGNPTTQSAYYNYLSNQGLHAMSSLQLTRQIWNGEWYDFESPVTIDIDAAARLYRYNDWNTGAPMMDGTNYANISVLGGLPSNVSSWMQIIQHVPGIDDRNPDWQMGYNANFVVTSPFHPSIPTPGASALLGLGGLVVARRRR